MGSVILVSQLRPVAPKQNIRSGEIFNYTIMALLLSKICFNGLNTGCK